jgi:hypothetical protein
VIPSCVNLLAIAALRSPSGRIASAGRLVEPAGSAQPAQRRFDRALLSGRGGGHRGAGVAGRDVLEGLGVFGAGGEIVGYQRVPEHEQAAMQVQS